MLRVADIAQATGEHGLDQDVLDACRVFPGMGDKVKPNQPPTRGERVRRPLRARIRRASDRLEPRVLVVALVGQLITFWVSSAAMGGVASGSAGAGAEYVSWSAVVAALSIAVVMVLVLGIVLGFVHRDGQLGWISMALGTILAVAIAVGMGGGITAGFAGLIGVILLLIAGTTPTYALAAGIGGAPQ